MSGTANDALAPPEIGQCLLFRLIRKPRVTSSGSASGGLFKRYDYEFWLESTSGSLEYKLMEAKQCSNIFTSFLIYGPQQEEEGEKGLLGRVTCNLLGTNISIQYNYSDELVFIAIFS